MNNYPYYTERASVKQEATLIQRVSYLLCASLIVTAGAASWADSIGLNRALFWPLAIAAFVCVFAMSATRTKPDIGLALLFTLSVIEGALLGPMLGSIARNYNLGGAIIAESAGLSAILVAGLGTYAWVSTKDFGGLGKTLFWALIGLIVVGFIAVFVNIGGMLSLLYAFAGTAIFCGFVLYDVSNIKRRYGPNDYVIATVQLYLDFLNLFLFILQILTSLSGGGGRRSS